MDHLLTELEHLGAEPRTALEEVFLDDKKLFLECLQQFPEDTNMAQLRKSLSSGDLTTAIRAVHTLKGVADNLGLLPIVDASYTVLNDLRSGKNERAVDDLVELEDVYSKFSELLCR